MGWARRCLGRLWNVSQCHRIYIEEEGEVGADDRDRLGDREGDPDARARDEVVRQGVADEAIADGKKIRVKSIERMWGLGTPEDLRHYLEHHK